MVACGLIGVDFVEPYIMYMFDKLVIGRVFVLSLISTVKDVMCVPSELPAVITNDPIFWLRVLATMF